MRPRTRQARAVGVRPRPRARRVAPIVPSPVCLIACSRAHHARTARRVQCRASHFGCVVRHTFARPSPGARHARESSGSLTNRSRFIPNRTFVTTSPICIQIGTNRPKATNRPKRTKATNQHGTDSSAANGQSARQGGRPSGTSRCHDLLECHDLLDWSTRSPWRRCWKLRCHDLAGPHTDVWRPPVTTVANDERHCAATLMATRPPGAATSSHRGRSGRQFSLQNFGDFPTGTFYPEVRDFFPRSKHR